MKVRISATIDKETEKVINEFLKEGKYRNKSHVIEDALKMMKENKAGAKK